ncbi:MAG TPA: transcriptional regulator [Clostridiales bacterium]|nr:transcriptional regulator [Clostridiales bacterium]
MGTNPTKAANNIYCRYRKQAAKYNDKLNSREGAAELLGISPSSLADYELNITKFVPVDKVLLMADLYNAPELKMNYCANECPLGAGHDEMPDMPAERIYIRVKNAIDEIDQSMNTLSDIMDDGIITDDEKSTLKDVKSQFIKSRQRIDEAITVLEKAERSGRF